MGLFTQENKITPTFLKSKGFTMGYWGTPDSYTTYKTISYTRKNNRKPHWKPCRKFYEYYDEDHEITYFYFPKTFEGYVITSRKYGDDVRGCIVVYQDDDVFDMIVKEINTESDLNLIMYEVEKLCDEII